ncbi:MAG: STM4011 family radical SAM protein [Gammaproteobacteria bacterium]|nr:STM4011 family radical SAM protein [Gammaproteobacteria bacterium]MDH5803108.1 STM4011 family radical SAM protein [Gammaproteobacteria bacterium]
MNFNILYRGYLSSCNFSCDYCPFAKQQDDKSAREKDQHALRRFVQWVQRSQYDLNVLFTPWGEALIRKWYQQALVELSHCASVRKVAVQTNLSCKLDWLRQCKTETTALWVSYHPSEMVLDSLLVKCEQLLSIGIRFSVGMVGLVEHIPVLQQLRKHLPNSVYVWVNACKAPAVNYSAAQIQQIVSIDPCFEDNLRNYRSLNELCFTGEDTFSVRADGGVSRCHFTAEELGNIYEQDLLDLVGERPCPRGVCDCHIGYVHMKRLNLRNKYKTGLLERILYI